MIGLLGLLACRSPLGLLGGEVVQDTACEPTEWFEDEDGDGYGEAGGPTVWACEPPDGHVDNDGDCEDTDPAIAPSAKELCDGLDNDCDGLQDEDRAADETCLVGDWTTQGGWAERTGYFPGTVGGRTPTLAWTADVDGVLNPAVVADGVLYRTSKAVTSTADSQAAAYDAATGEALWTQRLGDWSTRVHPPSFDSGVLLVQRDDGLEAELLALDGPSGGAVWSTPYEAQTQRHLAPAASDRRVWFNGGYSGGMYGFSSGGQLFFVDLPFYDLWTPTYADGVLYTWVEGVLTAHDPDSGATLWTVDLGWSGVSYSLGTAPVVHQDTAVVKGSGYLAAVDLPSRTERWRVQVSAPPLKGGVEGTPALANGVVYVIAGGDVLALDAQDGEVLGTYENPMVWPEDSDHYDHLIVTDDTLLLSAELGTSLFDLESFELLDTLPHGGWLALSDGRLFITDFEGEIAAYSWGEE